MKIVDNLRFLKNVLKLRCGAFLFPASLVFFDQLTFLSFQICCIFSNCILSRIEIDSVQ